MDVLDGPLPGIKILSPRKHGDHRGFFSETYNRESLRKAGIHDDFVQDNHSLSAERGVVRGLHYQLPPMAQAKLIRVVHGAILDIVVDIRRASPTFGQSFAAELSVDNWKQIYVPPGFAHGFATLTPNAEVVYKVSNYYSPQHERGILWNDPALKIDWKIDDRNAILSDRDRKHPMLADASDLF
jgi:dTDP-4-dehydrorhamnose 3,5-epimerase